MILTNSAHDATERFVQSRTVLRAPRLVPAALALLVWTGCARETGPPQSSVPPPRSGTAESALKAAEEYEAPDTAGYVGSAACRRCHERIAESYAHHPMANSVRPVTSERAARFESGRVGNDRHFLLSRESKGRLIHAESMVGTDGKTIWTQPFEMDFMVGSGQRAHAFLIFDHNMLFQSPLNWYAASGDWDLAPGYVLHDVRRFRRRATDECLACHAGRVHSIGRNLNRFAAPVFHEASVGCENCHGPGQSHIAFHEFSNTLAAQEGRDPIVQPARLPVTERESICYQCHLQTTARVLRPGRSHLDFRPGMVLHDVWTPVEVGDENAKAVRHVQQMRQSQCFVHSDGKLGCISCHDPHSKPTRQERTDFFRSRCFACHTAESCTEAAEQRRPLNDSCIHCHMPSFGAPNMAHVSQTDHRIVRRPPAEPASPAASNPSSNITLRYFGGIDRELPEWERQRGLGIAMWAHTDTTGEPAPNFVAEMLTPALTAAPDDHFAPTLLAAFYRQRGQLAEAQRFYRLAEQLPAGQESAWEGLLVTCYLLEQWAEVLPYANRMIELMPSEARFYALRADILQNLGQFQQAVASAQKAIELDPTLVSVRRWLVDALRRQGQADEAAIEQSTLKKMLEAAEQEAGPSDPSSATGPAQPETGT